MGTSKLCFLNSFCWSHDKNWFCVLAWCTYVFFIWLVKIKILCIKMLFFCHLINLLEESALQVSLWRSTIRINDKISRMLWFWCIKSRRRLNYCSVIFWVEFLEKEDSSSVLFMLLHAFIPYDTKELKCHLLNRNINESLVFFNSDLYMYDV